ncbi:IPTL-CTERM sorting domain-containing protein [Pulveribacter suum]|uniref:IPTL-CTERM sorting domain-containing protein n=1 Tax=Pulveribacter suum TaxID=2116657 RepID=UPI001475E446|nr:IPTL-CTERM sorting domain-containing protein [Pulveribacter suum]
MTNQTALVKVILNNTANASAATGTNLTVPLAGLTVSNVISTCVPLGSLAIVNSGTPTAHLELSGGTVPAGSTCEITANVRSAASGTYPSDIAANALASSNGSNPDASSVSLVVNGVKPLVGAKTFDKNTLRGGETAKVTVTITNPNNLNFSALQASDGLPPQLTIATPSNLATTCGAGATAWDGPTNTASLTAGTIGPNTSCTFSFNVTPANPTAFLSMTAENKITGSNVSATDSSGNTANAGGDFSANVNVRTGAQIQKRFADDPVTHGSASSFTLRVTNHNLTPLTGISFTDTVPAGITVTGISGTCNGVTPTFTAAAVTLSNAALAPDSGCSFTVNFTGHNTGTGPITANNAPGTFTAPGGGAVSFGGGVVPNILGDQIIVNPNPTGPGNGSGGLSATKRFAKTAGTQTRTLNVVQTETFDLIVTLRNGSSNPATGVAFSDNLASMGAGFSVASGFASPAGLCGGTLTASGTSIALSGATIAAGGTCEVEVPVTVAANAARTSFENRIGSGTLNALTGVISGTPHTWAGVDWANVTVGPALSVNKTFMPATIATKDHAVSSALTIKINRATGAAEFTSLAFDDAFPAAGAPLTVNTTPLSNTCGGTVNITPQTAGAAGHITLTGGTITGAAGSCAIVVGFEADQDAAGSYTNSLAAGAVVAAGGVQNETTGSGTLTLDAKVATLGLSKRFDPILLSKMGETSTLTIEISNVDGTPKQTGVTLTDNLPFGMKVAPAPAASASPSCGATPTFAPTAGASVLTLTGADIEPGAVCTLTVVVTGNAVGNLINVIPAGNITTDPFPGWPSGMTNTGPAQATIQVPAKDASGAPVGLDLAVAITNNANGICAGSTTTYVVTVTNPGGADVGGASLVNMPPAGITYGNWTVMATGGAVPSAMTGSGALNETVSLPKGGKLVYTITASVDAAAAGPLTNTATVKLPVQAPALVDANAANDTASDTDPVTTGCVAGPGGTTSIPTLSEWALIALSMLLAAFALRRMPLPSGRRS